MLVKCFPFVASSPYVESTTLPRGITGSGFQHPINRIASVEVGDNTARLSPEHGKDRLSGLCPRPTCGEVRLPGRLLSQVLRSQVEFGEQSYPAWVANWHDCGEVKPPPVNSSWRCSRRVTTELSDRWVTRPRFELRGRSHAGRTEIRNSGVQECGIRIHLGLQLNLWESDQGCAKQTPPPPTPPFPPKYERFKLISSTG